MGRFSASLNSWVNKQEEKLIAYKKTWKLLSGRDKFFITGLVIVGILQVAVGSVMVMRAF